MNTTWQRTYWMAAVIATVTVAIGLFATGHGKAATKSAPPGSRPGVVTGDRVDQRWIITQGLEPGEPVVIEGLRKVRPGLRVTPRPYSDPTPSTTPGADIDRRALSRAGRRMDRTTVSAHRTTA
jgi:hypothetical protein